MDLIVPAEQREAVKAGVDRVLECSHRDDRLEPLMDAIGVADGIARGSVGGKVAAILRGEPISTCRSRAAAPPRNGTWLPRRPFFSLRAGPSATPMDLLSSTTPVITARPAAKRRRRRWPPSILIFHSEAEAAASTPHPPRRSHNLNGSKLTLIPNSSANSSTRHQPRFSRTMPRKISGASPRCRPISNSGQPTEGCTWSS